MHTRRCRLGDKRLEGETIIWAAGVQASPRPLGSVHSWTERAGFWFFKTSLFRIIRRYSPSATR